MIKRAEIGISGRSLGYEYLSLIRDYAFNFHLQGVTFEKHDGGIKVIAEGEEENLEKFSDMLQDSGSSVHAIENFYMKWADPTGEFSDFAILEHQP